MHVKDLYPPKTAELLYSAGNDAGDGFPAGEREGYLPIYRTTRNDGVSVYIVDNGHVVAVDDWNCESFDDAWAVPIGSVRGRRVTVPDNGLRPEQRGTLVEVDRHGIAKIDVGLHCYGSYIVREQLSALDYD